MSLIDFDSMIPLYHQLKSLFRDRIESGQWPPGEMIPSETCLSTELGVSRVTVRRAIEDLTREGLFQRKQGRGTFVNPPKIEQGLGRFYSFSKDMEAKGLNPRSKILKLVKVLPKAKTRTLLQLGDTDYVYELQRLRLAKEEPIILETSWLPARLFAGLSLETFNGRSLYDIMHEDYGVQPVRAEEYFEPVLIDEYESKYLNVDVRSAGLLLHRVAFDRRGVPVEVCKAIVRGDKCRYYVRLP